MCGRSLSLRANDRDNNSKVFSPPSPPLWCHGKPAFGLEMEVVQHRISVKAELLRYKYCLLQSIRRRFVTLAIASLPLLLYSHVHSRTESKDLKLLSPPPVIAEWPQATFSWQCPHEIIFLVSIREIIISLHSLYHLFNQPWHLLWTGWQISELHHTKCRFCRERSGHGHSDLPFNTSDRCSGSVVMVVSKMATMMPIPMC